jgi:hypothetical protein
MICTVTIPWCTDSMISSCHLIATLSILLSMHSPLIRCLHRHCRVHEPEQWQMSKIWLQRTVCIVLVINIRILSMNQGAYMMLSTLAATWNASQLNCRQHEVASSRTPSKPIYKFALAAHRNYNVQNLGHNLLTSATTLHHHWWNNQYSTPILSVSDICYLPLHDWPRLRTYYVMRCLLVCENQSRKMLGPTENRLFISASLPRMLVFESAIEWPKQWGFGRIGVALQHNG